MTKRVWALYDAGCMVGLFTTEALAEESRLLHGGGDHLEVTWWPVLAKPLAPRPEPEPVPWDQLTPEEQALATLVFGRTGDEPEPAVTAAIELPADLNTEDDHGRHFARVTRAVDPSRVVVGAVLLAGAPGAAELSRVVEVSDGVAYFVEATDETRQRVWAAAPDEEASDE